MSKDLYIIDNSKGKNIKYKEIKLLGRGGFGKCFLLIREDDKERQYAGKYIEYKKSNSSYIDEKEKEKILEKLKPEISIYQLEHINIVKYYNHFVDANNPNYFCILLEYCEFKDLKELLNKRKHLTEIEVQCYIKQLISALKYLHSKNIIHRDLKTRNIFLAKNRNEGIILKLGDFGLSKKINEGEENILDKHCGTPGYEAPEIFEGIHSFKGDIWAVGIIIYELLFGKLPFDYKLKQYKELVKKGDYTFPKDIKVSNISKDLIKQILKPDPKKRPSLDLILKHDFFNQKIPDYMPIETLEQPPPLPYIKQYSFVDEEGILKRPLTFTNLLEYEKYEDINIEINIEKKEEENLKGVKIWIEDYLIYDNNNICIYLLNNGYYGIYFKKDNNKYNISINPKTDEVIYIDVNNRKILGKKEINEDLEHKLLLLRNQKEKLKKYDTVLKKEENIFDKYLINYREENDAKFFWFDNYDMQVILEEGNHPEILYSVENKVITYVNFQKGRINYSINSIKNKEINNNKFDEHLKYVTDTLLMMRKK